jgi:predicted DNA-binding protein YlxM (UPF0122 family)
LSSPLQAAKARLLLILLYRSEQNQRWIDEANHALNEKRKLDEEIEEVFEEIPSVEEIAKEMISPLESRLQNPEFTKQDYWWYLDRGNKDARTFLRKHYYSNFPGFRNAGSVQKDAFELNNRPTVSDLKKLEHQLKMDKERRIRKEIMGARQKAINKHKQLTEGCASS